MGKHIICSKNLLKKPVFLYVKTHTTTGLKYFGRTSREPFSYIGSGLYWIRHLKTHGTPLDTQIMGVYLDMSILNRDALKFSDEFSIVQSNDWANLITETGYSGVKGWNMGKDSRHRISENSSAMWNDPEVRERMRDSQSKSWTTERKLRHSKRMKEVWRDVDFRGKNLDGRTVTPEIRDRARQLGLAPKTDTHRANISKSLSGTVKSEAHRRNLSLSKTGRPSKIPLGCVWDQSTELFITSNGLHIKKMDVNYKKWMCIETKNRYMTLAEAVSLIG